MINHIMIDKSSIDFLQSYSDGRLQCTQVNKYTSVKAKLQCGTAQGSILETPVWDSPGLDFRNSSVGQPRA